MIQKEAMYLSDRAALSYFNETLIDSLYFHILVCPQISTVINVLSGAGF